MINELTEAECRFAIKNGDFAESLRTRAKSVAIVLTQSWCPQWLFVKAFLPSAVKEAGDKLAVYFVEYDTKDWFEEFLLFKENTFANYDVPYIRYYSEGKLTAESNMISKQGFLKKSGIIGHLEKNG